MESVTYRCITGVISAMEKLVYILFGSTFKAQISSKHEVIHHPLQRVRQKQQRAVSHGNVSRINCCLNLHLVGLSRGLAAEANFGGLFGTRR